MKFRRNLCGLTGLLSLIGFIGVFTEDRGFLAFFAFAVNFEYFFMKSDEMLEECMDKSASLVFYCAMIATAICTLISFFISGQDGHIALLTGTTLGWAVAVFVHSVSTVCYRFKESWVIGNDK